MGSFQQGKLTNITGNTLEWDIVECSILTSSLQIWYFPFQYASQQTGFGRNLQKFEDEWEVEMCLAWLNSLFTSHQRTWVASNFTCLPSWHVNTGNQPLVHTHLKQYWGLSGCERLMGLWGPSSAAPCLVWHSPACVAHHPTQVGAAGSGRVHSAVPGSSQPPHSTPPPPSIESAASESLQWREGGGAAQPRQVNSRQTTITHIWSRRPGQLSHILLIGGLSLDWVFDKKGNTNFPQF